MGQERRVSGTQLPYDDDDDQRARRSIDATTAGCKQRPWQLQIKTLFRQNQRLAPKLNQTQLSPLTFFMQLYIAHHH